MPNHQNHPLVILGHTTLLYFCLFAKTKFTHNCEITFFCLLFTISQPRSTLNTLFLFVLFWLSLVYFLQEFVYYDVVIHSSKKNKQTKYLAYSLITATFLKVVNIIIYC